MSEDVKNSLLRNKLNLILAFANTLVSIIYLVMLNNLNRNLLRLGLQDSPIELLMYNDKQALQYFMFALLFAVLSAILMYHYYRQLINHSEEEILDLVLLLILILLNIVLIIAIIILINNPILRAVAFFVALGGVLGFSQSK